MKTINPGAGIRLEGPSKNSRQTTDALLSPRGQVGMKNYSAKRIKLLKRGCNWFMKIAVLMKYFFQYTHIYIEKKLLPPTYL